MMLPHHLRHSSLGHGLVIQPTFDFHLSREGIFGKPQLGRVNTACAFELDYSVCVLAEVDQSVQVGQEHGVCPCLFAGEE
jgi:hypothetical protein